MDPKHVSQPTLIIIREWLDIDHLVVHPITNGAIWVEEERHAARHPGAEVPARRSEHDCSSTRHVLAAVVSHALDDRRGSRVANTEPLPDLAPHIELT